MEDRLRLPSLRSSRPLAGRFANQCLAILQPTE
jgi:hypothetical protein